MKIKGIDNFIIPEFVPPEIWDTYGKYSVRFLSPGLMELAQALRNYFDRPMTINNWYFKKDRSGFQWRGYRTPDCPVGSQLSRHKLGLCIDFNVRGLKDEEVQAEIKRNYEKVFRDMGVTAIEADTPTWTHVSMETTLKDGLWVIPNPAHK